MHPEPTLITLDDLRPGPPAPGTPMHTADLAIWWGSLLSAGLGMLTELMPRLLAQVAPALDPQHVSWAFVALTAVGGATLGVRLLYAYAMARLDVHRIKGENEALKAQVAAYQREAPRV